MISDYMKEDSREILLKIRQEAVSFMYGFDIPLRDCYNSTKQADGLDSGVVPFQAATINGKGIT